MLNKYYTRQLNRNRCFIAFAQEMHKVGPRPAQEWFLGGGILDKPQYEILRWENEWTWCPVLQDISRRSRTRPGKQGRGCGSCGFETPPSAPSWQSTVKMCCEIWDAELGPLKGYKKSQDIPQTTPLFRNNKRVSQDIPAPRPPLQTITAKEEAEMNAANRGERSTPSFWL